MKLHSKRTLTLVLLALLCAMLVGGQDVQQEQQQSKEEGEAGAALALPGADQEHGAAAVDQQVRGRKKEGVGPDRKEKSKNEDAWIDRQVVV